MIMRILSANVCIPGAAEPDPQSLSSQARLRPLKECGAVILREMTCGSPSS